MSAYVCEPRTIATVAFHSNLDSRTLGILNLRAVGWRYNLTETEATKQFLGLNRKQYLFECENYTPIPEADVVSLCEEVLYQCSEGNFYTDKTYLRLSQFKERIKNESK